MKTKLVSFAYPSSCLADQLDFSKTGCFIVDYLEGDKTPILALKKGFSTWDEAMNEALKLPEPFSLMQRLKDN